MLNAKPSARRGLRHPQVRNVPRPDLKLEQLPGATRRPHICFVAPEAWPVFSRDPRIPIVGGAEVQQSILARLLARAGYRVSMICLDYGQPRRVEEDGVVVHRMHRRDEGIPVLRFIHPRITGVWRAMREVDADIYYQRSVGMLTGVVAAFCRRHGKRSIYAGASDSDFVPGRQTIRFRRDRWLFERGLAGVDAIVVQNQAQQRDCLAHYHRTSILIPSCYELPADACRGPGEYVLWVGTVCPEKRPELCLELARRLPQRRFVMVGGIADDDRSGGAYYGGIRQAALMLPNVEFTGFLPLAEAERRFDRARVVLSTSPAEGMPNIFLQAWARGVPTLAFIDVGARLNDKPVYRVLADADDAVAQIERLFVDSDYEARAAADSRAYFAATHASDEVLARYQRVLDELGEAHRR